MSERWLKCNIFKGMFSDERVVVVATSGGEKVSAFVPIKLVEGAIGEPGRVRVRAYEENDCAWALLPDENQTMIDVKLSELVAS